MSKIGKLPITVKESMNVTITGQEISITGSKGTFTYTIPSSLAVTFVEGKLTVTQKKKGDVMSRAVFGLTRANLANLIHGAEEGFTKKLELTGVGYRATMQGTDLVLSLGFSHPVKFTPEPGITFTVQDNAVIVSGSDKTIVGNTAANIRKVRPPEPYKGKGIKYSGEYIRRKAGKAAKAVGGK